MKRAVLFLLVAAVTGGLGATAGQDDPGKKELAKFKGAWTYRSIESGGNQVPAEVFKAVVLTIEGDKFAVKDGDKVVQAGTLRLDPTKTPKAIDAKVSEGQNEGTVMLGVYEFDGDEFKACFDPEGKKRPTAFKSEPESPNFLANYKRSKK